MVAIAWLLSLILRRGRGRIIGQKLRLWLHLLSENEGWRLTSRFHSIATVLNLALEVLYPSVKLTSPRRPIDCLDLFLNPEGFIALRIIKRLLPSLNRLSILAVDGKGLPEQVVLARHLK